MHRMALLLVVPLGGCVADAGPTTADSLHGDAALEPVQALLVPCQTPSGGTAALAVLSSGDDCPSTPGREPRTRDCAVWKSLLEHPFACQPGAPLRRPDAQDAAIFWLSGAAEPGDLTGATATRVTRWRCGDDAPRSLHGDVLVLQDGPQGAEIDIQVDNMEGIVRFTVCR